MDLRQNNVHKYIDENVGNPFVLGKWDCFKFVHGWYKLCGGKNKFSFMKNYKTEKGWFKKLKAEGYDNLEALLDDTFKQRQHAFISRGDIVMKDQMMGLCVGIKCAFLCEDRPGYVFYKTSEVDKGWDICQEQ